MELGRYYDVAACARFDLGQLDRVHRRIRVRDRIPDYAVSQINFQPTFEMNFLYSAMWNRLNHGFADQWFYSNPDLLLRLRGIYARAFHYLSPGSDYLAWLTGGITDSKLDDALSNEILRPVDQKATELDMLDLENGIHNHLIHKYFFLEQDIYNKSAFTQDFEGAAHVLYTHTDYKDLWPVYFDQENRFFNAFQRNYICVNRFSEDVPPHYTQLVYDEALSYTDRLRICIKQVPEPVLFFDHEFMFLVDPPDIPALRRAHHKIRQPGQRRFRKVDLVRLARTSLDQTFKPPFGSEFRYFLPWSRRNFSIQPSFWSTSRFLDLLAHHRGEELREFESSAGETMGARWFRGATLWTGGQKVGKLHWNNPIFPYLPFAMDEERWNTSSHGIRLRSLLAMHDIDISKRGEV